MKKTKFFKIIFEKKIFVGGDEKTMVCSNQGRDSQKIFKGKQSLKFFKIYRGNRKIKHQASVDDNTPYFTTQYRLKSMKNLSFLNLYEKI